MCKINISFFHISAFFDILPQTEGYRKKHLFYKKIYYFLVRDEYNRKNLAKRSAVKNIVIEKVLSIGVLLSSIISTFFHMLLVIKLITSSLLFCSLYFFRSSSVSSTKYLLNSGIILIESNGYPGFLCSDGLSIK